MTVLILIILKPKVALWMLRIKVVLCLHNVLARAQLIQTGGGITTLISIVKVVGLMESSVA